MQAHTNPKFSVSKFTIQNSVSYIHRLCTLHVVYSILIKYAYIHAWIHYRLRCDRRVFTRASKILHNILLSLYLYDIDVPIHICILDNYTYCVWCVLQCASRPQHIFFVAVAVRVAVAAVNFGPLVHFSESYIYFSFAFWLDCQCISANSVNCYAFFWCEWTFIRASCTM